MSVKENIKDINNGSYGDKIKNKSIGYKNGAIVGVIVGALAGLYFKRFIMFSLIGLVGGGYVGYKIAEATESKVEFKTN